MKELLRIEYNDTPDRVVEKIAQIMKRVGIEIEYVPGDRDGFELYEIQLNQKVANSSLQMLEAIGEFCERVEKGEVRSKYTYGKFKAIISNIES